ncbi:MAG: hypothetical protein E6G69_13705 [Alphaproteobacteria bacterium]|nr:MAG: hypothetical protein E6G69_13705 [Alphaproteobacteria bacterium]
MAILLGAELDFNDRARGRPRRAEHFFPAHDDLDRPAGFLRQQIGDRFEIDDRLPAKAAADLGRDRADAGNVGAADARGVGAHHELTLARAPDRALPVGPDRHEAGMRLDVSLVHRFCRVAPLDDQIGLLEAGFDIANIRAMPAEIGGGFGGKTLVYLEPVALALSKKSGRPVKIVMSREEVFRGTGPAAGGVYEVKLGAKKDGRLVAAELVVKLQAGAFPGSPVGPACMCGLAMYDIPHVGIVMSAPKLARPVTLSTPSGRIGRVPTRRSADLSR